MLPGCPRTAAPLVLVVVLRPVAWQGLALVPRPVVVLRPVLRLHG